MEAILTRAGCFVGLIVMGYLLRRVGFFKQEDFALLSKIVINARCQACSASFSFRSPSDR